MTVAHYEVLSLRIASDPQRTVGTNFFFDSFPGPADLPMPQDYLSWVLRGDGRCILVDTCFTAASAERRRRHMHRSLEALLADLDIEPAGVTDVIMTHLHWDHAGNIGLFPNARFHVQAAELAFCTGPAMLHQGVSKIYNREDVQSFMAPLFEGRVAIVDGDATLFPGIDVHKVGGHTPGSMTVTVATRRGPVVLASDAAHFYANFQGRSPFPILENFPQALTAFDIIDRLSGGSIAHVIPGHDPIIASAYPKLGERHADIVCLHENPVIDIAAAMARQFSLGKTA
ncbi:N-acyl homoserine lactonase family protein [Rhizobium sp. BK602]|uniref:N-acyl homoserine lactonase family protein n=1 Tax=Rhizobium sp. BK602 TaxID=2586986 RepID=UPI0016178F3E|nr:N-acyl homoserine lactonase family protein [Rhizobium sp. BK602]MBB3610461.1 glyoxylase-like metal-dependent hydrolase (beta-lactamase superfamily II) [Rhizobium sp. BK602]